MGHVHENLASALVAFQSEMPTVAKGRTADTGKFSYTYADLADVVEAATPVLTAHGLAFTARPRRTDAGDYELVGVLTHTSGDEKEGSLPLMGRTAQEIGSSITYGRRYLLGCMTGIVTDDDDDAQVASQSQHRTRPQPPPETPEQALSNARAGAWALYKAQPDPLATQGGFTDAYENWCARPFVDATADDFAAFAAYLRGSTP